jgi:competence protein ComEA
MLEKLRQIKAVDGMLLAGLGLIAIGIGLNMKGLPTGQSANGGQKVEVVKAKISPTAILEKKMVVFEMSGEVVKPGVYKLDAGSRLHDALVVSGGLAVDADRVWVEKNINQAEIIGDGMKIYIPKIGEVKVTTVGQVSGVQTVNNQINKLININSATVEELDKLSGVGPAIAGRIIDYRNQNGGFKDINELKLVSGIGDKMYDKIKDNVGL